MRTWMAVAIAMWSWGLLASCAGAEDSAFPPFKTQEIAKDLKIGYAVITADVNGDGKPDIVVVDQHRVIWYENPSWKVHTIISGKTKPDNVCIAATDIDGDGKIDFVLGAGWRPADTTNPGTLQWLSRGNSLDEEWTIHPIPCDEPTVHRVQAIDLDRTGKPQIVMVPLQGRGASAKGNWTDGRPVRIISYTIPSDPKKPEQWKPVVLTQSLYVIHNFCPLPDLRPERPMHMLTASYDGVHRFSRQSNGEWKGEQLGTGNQENLKSSRGASEIQIGRIGPNKTTVIGTVEPWHGNQIVVYTPNDAKKAWDRRVVDAQLRWGHAIKFADLDGDGTDELIAGVRDDPNPKQGDTFTERMGVRLYRNSGPKVETWTRHLLDEGGVAVEDLAVADLNGDGKPDIVAVGRKTSNCRIYWNMR